MNGRSEWSTVDLPPSVVGWVVKGRVPAEEGEDPLRDGDAVRIALVEVERHLDRLRPGVRPGEVLLRTDPVVPSDHAALHPDRRCRLGREGRSGQLPPAICRWAVRGPD